MMKKYVTISVPANVKKQLQNAKGKKEWGEFLLEMCNTGQQAKSKKAFEELTKLVTKKDLETMTESSKDFREKFSLR